MTLFDELNKYIKHYLEQDKTNSAIMLTAPWGTGKSYYIKKVLMPYLNVDNKINCIAISLYGLNNIDEISKSIYFELRLKDFLPQTEGLVIGSAIGKAAGKTILKQIINFIGIDVDLGVNKDTMQSIYNSIDLTGKLIVFEDVERSGIDIIEFLGYVNNLVEQDGVKVLLVANEDEITNNELKEKNEDITKVIESVINQNYSKVNDSVEVELSDKTKKYLQIKEKTVSDTIIFHNDYESAICNIIRFFENERLKMYANVQKVKEIIQLFSDQQNYNLRSFIFACQKTVDLYSYIDGNYDEDFMKSIFYGNIIFALKMKAGKVIKWDGDRYLSINLGNRNYPLYYFCYQYIQEQHIPSNNIQEYADEYKKLRLYDDNELYWNTDLQVLYSWHLRTDDEVLNALNNIEKSLENNDNISLYQYGKLAYYLVLVGEVLNWDISKCKQLLIENLKGKGSEINKDRLLYPFDEIENASKRDEYKQLIENIHESLDMKDNFFEQFDYNPQNIKLFLEYSCNNEQNFLERGTYVSMLDIDKFVDMIKGCTAHQINDVRNIFVPMYSASHNFVERDKRNIGILLEKVKGLNDYPGFDKIQCKQIDYFISNLQDILERMDI